MFEPQVFSDKATGQDALMAALQRRDMKAFELALKDPQVEPDFWYGKPYWTTCLQLAAKTEGCEAFVMALLRAGAGNVRSHNRPRNSDPTATKTFAADRIVKILENGGVCGLERDVNGDLHVLEYSRLSDEDFGPLSAPAGACGAAAEEDEGGGADGATGAEQVLGLWLRDTTRTLRDTAEQMRRELRALAQGVEQLGERVAGVERAQAQANALLLRLKR